MFAWWTFMKRGATQSNVNPCMMMQWHWCGLCYILQGIFGHYSSPWGKKAFVHPSSHYGSNWTCTRDITGSSVLIPGGRSKSGFGYRTWEFIFGPQIWQIFIFESQIFWSISSSVPSNSYRKNWDKLDKLNFYALIVLLFNCKAKIKLEKKTANMIIPVGKLQKRGHRCLMLDCNIRSHSAMPLIFPKCKGCKNIMELMLGKIPGILADLLWLILWSTSGQSVLVLQIALFIS